MVKATGTKVIAIEDQQDELDIPDIAIPKRAPIIRMNLTKSTSKKASNLHRDLEDKKDQKNQVTSHQKGGKYQSSKTKQIEKHQHQDGKPIQQNKKEKPTQRGTQHPQQKQSKRSILIKKK